MVSSNAQTRSMSQTLDKLFRYFQEKGFSREEGTKKYLHDAELLRQACDIALKQNNITEYASAFLQLKLFSSIITVLSAETSYEQEASALAVQVNALAEPIDQKLDADIMTLDSMPTDGLTDSGKHLVQMYHEFHTNYGMSIQEFTSFYQSGVALIEFATDSDEFKERFLENFQSANRTNPEVLELAEGDEISVLEEETEQVEVEEYLFGLTFEDEKKSKKDAAHQLLVQRTLAFLATLTKCENLNIYPVVKNKKTLLVRALGTKGQLHLKSLMEKFQMHEKLLDVRKEIYTRFTPRVVMPGVLTHALGDHKQVLLERDSDGNVQAVLQRGTLRSKLPALKQLEDQFVRVVSAISGTSTLKELMHDQGPNIAKYEPEEHHHGHHAKPSSNDTGGRGR